MDIIYFCQKNVTFIKKNQMTFIFKCR